jgi:phosphatidylglycerol:prolipoprotein diacylglycerol transferase
MSTWLNFYQNLPQNINPTAFSVGFINITWYSLTYMAAFSVAYGLLLWRIKKGEGQYKSEMLFDLTLWSVLSVIIGGRLGYVLFYNLPYYIAHPLEIISPWDSTGNFVGIYGMSYHGGLIGIILAGLIFAKKRKINFWQLSDWAIPVIPAGYFFGRLGNFLNGELYGRVTEKPWGMFFEVGDELRHPSQLYEAFLEGILLFAILWPLRNRPKLQGIFLSLYFIGYALARIIAEFFREPDEQIGYILGFLTLGQILSFLMLVTALVIIKINKKKTESFEISPNNV